MLDMIFLMIAMAANGGSYGISSGSAFVPAGEAPAAIVAAPTQEAPTESELEAPAAVASTPTTTVFAGGKEEDSASVRTSESPPAPATDFLTPKQEIQSAPAATTFLAPKQEAPAAPATTFLAPPQEAPVTAFLTPKQEAPATTFLAPTQQAPATTFLAPKQETQTAPPTAFLAPQTDQTASVPTFLAPATGLVAEPQTPTGRFTTALEVKPILNATRATWIFVREYDGKDLMYVTNLWSWRCGLLEMRVGINGNPPEIWPLPPCRLDQQSPAAILDEDGLSFAEFPLGSLALIEVQITYDDLTTDSAKFNRNGMLAP